VASTGDMFEMPDGSTYELTKSASDAGVEMQPPEGEAFSLRGAFS
jgi:hypothetical protein